MRKCLILALVLCLLAACGGEPSPTPDLVATQIAVEDAAHATMTARIPSATDTLTPTPVPSNTPSPRPTVTPPPGIEAREYAVYSALIRQNPIGYNLGSFIAIREQTTVSDADMFERTLIEAPGLPAELVDSYRSRNAASYTLSPNLDLEQDYALMSQAEFDELFGPGRARWTDFQARYPEAGGLVNVSRVGFGANGERALVLMGFRCGDLCGSGGLYLLVKEDGSWKVQQALMEWIS